MTENRFFSGEFFSGKNNPYDNTNETLKTSALTGDYNRKRSNATERINILVIFNCFRLKLLQVVSALRLHYYTRFRSAETENKYN